MQGGCLGLRQPLFVLITSKILKRKFLIPIIRATFTFNPPSDWSSGRAFGVAKPSPFAIPLTMVRGYSDYPLRGLARMSPFQKEIVCSRTFKDLTNAPF